MRGRYEASIHIFHKFPNAPFLLEHQSAPHAARGRADHQHAAMAVGIVLSVVDVGDDAFGKFRAEVGPLLHVEQAFDGLEIILVVSLELQGLATWAIWNCWFVEKRL